MAQSVQLREQAERCRRLARDSTDGELRETLLRLADEYGACAAVLECGDHPVQDAGNGDQAAE